MKALVSYGKYEYSLYGYFEFPSLEWLQEKAKEFTGPIKESPPLIGGIEHNDINGNPLSPSWFIIWLMATFPEEFKKIPLPQVDMGDYWSLEGIPQFKLEEV